VLGSVSTGMATCDIDGDGRAELIVSTREGLLYCIGSASNGSGLVKWSLDLGYSLGPPIVADFDGDGASEILVVSGDGHLYSIAAGTSIVS
jgi:outer membrane protein assembly factor BamB